MHVIQAVFDDLYTFVIQSVLVLVRVFIPNRPRAALHAPDTVTEKTREQVAEPVSKDSQPEVPEEEPQSTFLRVDQIIAKDEEKPEPIGKNTVMYVKSARLPVYKNPTFEFDAAITILTYGDMVMLLSLRGRWASIVHGEHSGWVLREELALRSADVHPKFVIGEKNSADDSNTIKVRAILKDPFGAALMELPLQAGEYVLYRLERKGLHIVWPEDAHPRMPGLWHTLLKGVPGIHIGISPKTGSVIEYMPTTEIGHLAYVESVSPEETITISEANHPHDGIYNERILTRDEWKELKPVFMQVSS